MDLSIKMSDERTLGVDPQQDRLKNASADINNGRGRDLLQLLNKVNLVVSFLSVSLSHHSVLHCLTHCHNSVFFLLCDVEQCIDTISGYLFSTMLFVYTGV